MVFPRSAIFQNRKHAASHLGERLRDYYQSDAVIVAVAGGGVEIGAYLAAALQIPLEVIPCKKIKHPADESKTIGAVCAASVVIHEEDNDIPQDYLYHQIQLLQHAIQGQIRKLERGDLEPVVKGREVILVDDVLMTGDSMLASIRTLRRYQPKDIVLAVPIVTPEGARAVAEEIQRVIYLSIEAQPVGQLYAEFPDLTDDEVFAILSNSHP